MNGQVRKGLEGPAKDGETVTLEQIDTDDENDKRWGETNLVLNLNLMTFSTGWIWGLEVEGDEEVEEGQGGGGGSGQGAGMLFFYMFYIG